MGNEQDIKTTRDSQSDGVVDSYTLEEIKKAFWVEFHKSGELWFSYLGPDEENEDCTNGYWLSFIDALKEIRK